MTNQRTFRILSLIPPMTQLNTPYPSTAYLTGFLRSQGLDAVQDDLALKLVLALLSKQGLADIRADALAQPEEMRSASVNFFLDYFDRYQATVDRVIAFLQGADPTLAHRIAARGYLPEGPRFQALDVYDDEGDDPLGWAFGALGLQDRARHYATLYLNDLADVVRDAVDERFEFVRYAESLAASQPTFEPLQKALLAEPTVVDLYLDRLTVEAIEREKPNLVLLSVPFPGSVYAAFRMAQTIRRVAPHVRMVLGGGFVNTELRELSEPAVFDFVDFVTLDSGERPVLSIIEHLQGKRSSDRLVRTYLRDDTGQVRFIHWPEPDVAFADVGTPTWDGLPLNGYL